MSVRQPEADGSYKVTFAHEGEQKDYIIRDKRLVNYIDTADVLGLEFDENGQSVIAAIFSSVNESIWEHMKLIYYPMLLFSLVEFRFLGKDHKQFWCIKLVGILLGLTLIPVLYYTYTGISGVSVDWLNITIFFISAGVAFWEKNKLFQKENGCCLSARTSFILICMIGVVFTLLTFFTPEIPFFKDPVTGSYGFQK